MTLENDFDWEAEWNRIANVLEYTPFCPFQSPVRKDEPIICDKYEPLSVRDSAVYWINTRCYTCVPYQKWGRPYDM